jgi:hypothetical protein
LVKPGLDHVGTLPGLWPDDVRTVPGLCPSRKGKKQYYDDVTLLYSTMMM